jgi:hypothetical protein
LTFSREEHRRVVGHQLDGVIGPDGVVHPEAGDMSTWRSEVRPMTAGKNYQYRKASPITATQHA